MIGRLLCRIGLHHIETGELPGYRIVLARCRRCGKWLPGT